MPKVHKPFTFSLLGTCRYILPNDCSLKFQRNSAVAVWNDEYHVLAFRPNLFTASGTNQDNMLFFFVASLVHEKESVLLRG